MRDTLLICVLVAGGSCKDDGSGTDHFADGGEDAGDETSAGETSAGDGTGTTSGGGTKYDVGSMETGTGGPPPEETCHVADDMNAIGECGEQALPDSFEPDVQWTWGGTNRSVTVTPLVANLTDDNDDNSIDLCDIPDVVVVASSGLSGQIVILNGLTGLEQMAIPVSIDLFTTPAIGDIDDDGLPEIVATTAGAKRLIAFEHDGTMKWMGTDTYTSVQGGSIGIANLDAEGLPEIYVDEMVVEANGITRFIAPPQEGGLALQENGTPTAADLDGDGTMEFILGQSAYDHMGNEVYKHPTLTPGYPQVANLDDDPEPEILLNNGEGITVLEHDGTIKVQGLRPTGDPAGFGGNNWYRPSTVHDFNDDNISEFAVSSATHYAVYDNDYEVRWFADVQDGSGWAAGTAFDFLGDGSADAMYADEVSLFVYDGDGTLLLDVPRSSATLSEYPVVADVDNDGSAEIIVVSSTPFEDQGPQTSPAVQVIRDIEDRWIQARRIWNQHTYHVTNVREDSTIPTVEPHHWKLLNTFRTNAQIENGEICDPEPAG